MRKYRSKNEKSVSTESMYKFQTKAKHLISKYTAHKTTCILKDNINLLFAIPDCKEL